ncbi:hypothetical protein [Lacticaseibacillus paracasei]
MGIKTNRNDLVYEFNKNGTARETSLMIDHYNDDREQVHHENWRHP